MRVAFLSHNAQINNAIGNQIAEKVRFFLEHGAEVRVFVEDAQRLHPDLQSVAVEAGSPSTTGPVWEYLRSSDLVFAVYAQSHGLLDYLPRLQGEGPRIIFDYYGVTPPALAHPQQRESQSESQRMRGYVWCADHALTTSRFAERELCEATRFPAEHTTRLPLPVDVARFHPRPRDRSLQARLGISGRILLFVGRIAANKRVAMLLEALAKLDPSVHAVIVGDDSDVYAEEAARCRAIAQQFGVEERVHWLGQIDDDELARAYRSADVMVTPSVHEGFCVPVIEAMASGVPVVASRSTALPETLGDAGLSFVADDVDDLARQLRRVLDDAPRPLPASKKRRIAIVSFRYGETIVGGAETSLRTMARALMVAGHHVEVFTTCTQSESRWANDVPVGTFDEVHRFPIDPHDAIAHGEIYRTILEANGNVDAATECAYLERSIHSSALLAALHARQHEFDAIFTGPYLFGLTADIINAFPRKTLLVPCYHDEPLARLAIWPRLAGAAGGILYHSEEEQAFAQAELGVNHPNARVIGTTLDCDVTSSEPRFARPYFVYCGRYSEQKNVPMLVEWARRYQQEHPDRIDFVFLGQGEVKLPSEPWLHDLGRVDEAEKRRVLAGAKALVQLSTHESLSLVALEAWREGTPVIAHADCAVLMGQIERSQGGARVSDYASFADTLNDLFANPLMWCARGQSGQAYVRERYGDADRYAASILGAIEQMHRPIAEQMRERGLQRAQLFVRERWRARSAEFVEQVLTQPARRSEEKLVIEPVREDYRVAAGTRTFLLPVRFSNTGTRAILAEGIGRTAIAAEILDAANGNVVASVLELRLPGLLIPGATQVGAIPLALPDEPGAYLIRLWSYRHGNADGAISNIAQVSIEIDGDRQAPAASSVDGFLQTVQTSLAKTHELQALPADYVDVTEGRLAGMKRLIKQKLLHNFKHAYVDVLSRQQSQVNAQVVVMIQQLAECCAMLDHAVRGLHQRLDDLEAKLEHEPARMEEERI